MKPFFVIKIIIILQIVLVIFLARKIIQQKINILGVQTNISTLGQSITHSPESSQLKYFYELSVGKTEIEKIAGSDKFATYIHNSDGLNDTQEYILQKPERTFRIITLGDSFTYGDGVNTNQNWTELLEKKLNSQKICQNIDKFEIINLGIKGYCIPYEVERYKIRGQKYNPDLIIWMLIDLLRLNEDISPLYFQCLDEKKDSDSCIIMAMAKARAKNPQQILKTISHSFDEFKTLNQQPIFFIDYYHTHSQLIKNYPHSTIYNDLSSSLEKQYSYSDIYLPNNGHPNEFAHQLIANLIYQKLFEYNQIPCQGLEQKQFSTTK